MAQRQRFNVGSAALGAIFAIAAIGIVGAIVCFGGLYPVGASTPHTASVRWLIGEARDRSVDRSAAGLTAPHFTQADILEGGSHFKGMCQECHGGPGAEPEEFAGAMNPRPPNLAEAASDLSVAQVFWIAKNGLKMTGMPAFGKTDSDDELWKVAAFVKQLPKVSATQYSALPNAHEREAEEQGHHH